MVATAARTAVMMTPMSVLRLVIPAACTTGSTADFLASSGVLAGWAGTGVSMFPLGLSTSAKYSIPRKGAWLTKVGSVVVEPGADDRPAKGLPIIPAIVLLS